MDMTQIVSLTSQGQISIPAKMLAKYGKNRPTKVIVKAVDSGWFVEPVPDILSLGGALHKYALKGKTLEEILELEEKAISDAIVEDYVKSIR